MLVVDNHELEKQFKRLINNNKELEKKMELVREQMALVTLSQTKLSEDNKRLEVDRASHYKYDLSLDTPWEKDDGIEGFFAVSNGQIADA